MQQERQEQQEKIKYYECLYLRVDVFLFFFIRITYSYVVNTMHRKIETL